MKYWIIIVKLYIHFPFCELLQIIFQGTGQSRALYFLTNWKSVVQMSGTGDSPPPSLLPVWDRSGV